MKLYAGQMQWAQCVHLAWRKRLHNASHEELDAAACKLFCLSLSCFSMLFSFKFKNLNLRTSYIKQCFLICAMEQIFSFSEASLNGTFHLLPHESICIIALINITMISTRWDCSAFVNHRSWYENNPAWHAHHCTNVCQAQCDTHGACCAVTCP